MMRYFIALVVVAAVLTASAVQSQETSDKPQPLLSLNTYLNFSQLQELPTSIYIGQALSFIFTGKYQGQGIEIDEDSELASYSLDQVLSGGLVAAAGFLEEKNPPGLNSECSNSVSVKMELVETPVYCP